MSNTPATNPRQRPDRLPFGFTNLTHIRAGTVVKTYDGYQALERMENEQAALQDLTHIIPVPTVLGSTNSPPTLTLSVVEGQNAAAVLDRQDQREQLFHQLGVFLRTFQEAYRLQCEESLIRVHGDFGPQNILLRKDGSVSGVVDWELSHKGDINADPAWLEWVVRMHYEVAIDALQHFYRGYNRIIPWSVRHSAMKKICQDHLQRARASNNHSKANTWLERLRATCSMEDICY